MQQKEQKTGSNDMSPEMTRKHYYMLAINMAINLAIMYLVMFAMIFRWGEFVQNINFFYMALMMWAPMGALMLLFMGMMYQNKTLNIIIYVSSVLIFVLAFIGIRDQALVGDKQFLRSMIPHHSGALVMCREASISDPQIKELCFGPEGIVVSQEKEIELMKKLLESK
jgi:uncharacterized protein (DUF305 family)